MTARAEPSPERFPHLPPTQTVAEVNAMKALYAGNASEQQQKAALAWILHEACRLDDLSYRPGADGALATAFAEGKRFPALQIKRLIEMTPERVEALLAREKAATNPQETKRG